MNQLSPLESCETHSTLWVSFTVLSLSFFLYLPTVYYHYRSRVRYVRNFHNRLFSAVFKGSTSFKTAVVCVLCGFYEFFIFWGTQCIKQREASGYQMGQTTE